MSHKKELFSTLTTEDCRRHIALARSTPNSVSEQIATKLSNKCKTVMQENKLHIIQRNKPMCGSSIDCNMV